MNAQIEVKKSPEVKPWVRRVVEAAGVFMPANADGERPAGVVGRAWSAMKAASARNGKKERTKFGCRVDFVPLKNNGSAFSGPCAGDRKGGSRAGALLAEAFEAALGVVGFLPAPGALDFFFRSSAALGPEGHSESVSEAHHASEPARAACRAASASTGSSRGSPGSCRGFPASSGGFPDGFRGSSDPFRGSPDSAWGFPDSFRGFPDSAWGFPDSFRGFPDSAGGSSGSFWGFPESFRGSSGSFWGFPESFRGSSGSFRGFPESFRGFPGSCRGSSDSGRGSPDSPGWTDGAVSPRRRVQVPPTRGHCANPNSPVRPPT
jgi:hypothetical protein